MRLSQYPEGFGNKRVRLEQPEINFDFEDPDFNPHLPPVPPPMNVPQANPYAPWAAYHGPELTPTQAAAFDIYKNFEKRKLSRDFYKANRTAKKAAWKLANQVSWTDATGSNQTSGFLPRRYKRYRRYKGNIYGRKRRYSGRRRRYGGRRFRGRGDYSLMDRASMALAGARKYGSFGGTVGSSFGPVGYVAGSLLGGIGGGIAGWFGRGDYQMAPFAKEIHGNSFMTAPAPLGSSTDAPRMTSTQRGCIIRHREYICDIIGGSNMTGPGGTSVFDPSRVFSVNPGLEQVFPWGASIAGQFSEYRLNGCIFEFKSTSQNQTTIANQGAGVVIIASQYNIFDDTFVSKVEMENSEFAQSCKPDLSMLHPIECAPNETPLDIKYVRHSDLIPTGDSMKFYDPVKVTVATEGLPFASMKIGELWISYDVEFLKPRMFGGMLANDIDASVYSHNGVAALLGGVDQPPMGSTQTLMRGNLNMSFVASAQKSIVSFPDTISRGWFIVSYSTVASRTDGLNAVGSLWTSGWFAPLVNTTVTQLENSTGVAANSMTYIRSPTVANGYSAAMMYCYLVEVSGPQATFEINQSILGVDVGITYALAGGYFMIAEVGQSVGLGLKALAASFGGPFVPPAVPDVLGGLVYNHYWDATGTAGVGTTLTLWPLGPNVAGLTIDPQSSTDVRVNNFGAGGGFVELSIENARIGEKFRVTYTMGFATGATHYVCPTLVNVAGCVVAPIIVFFDITTEAAPAGPSDGTCVWEITATAEPVITFRLNAVLNPDVNAGFRLQINDVF